jgi:large subunit ribosomal protein L6
MSRAGKSPIQIPSGVDVRVAGGRVTAKGKLGELQLKLGEQVRAFAENGKIVVEPIGESKQARMLWGTTRNLIRNMVVGVSQGFRRNLEISGVGYRAAVQGRSLQLQLGFSHNIVYPIPDDVTIACEKPTSISVFGRDKQRVGQIAAEIRAFRKPEPYKGKGIKYETETILRKEGKKK